MRTSYRRLKKVFCVLSLVVMVCLLTFFCATMNSETVYATTVDEIESGAGLGENPESDFNLNITTNSGSTSMSSTLKILLVLTVLTIAPSIILMVTSFTRIIIVLNFTRTAMGLQTTPPNQVLIGLALFLTFFVMSPTITQINENAIKPFEAGQITQEQAIEAGIEPLRTFMFEQTNRKDIKLFLEISGNEEQLENYNEIPTTTLVPAFMISELRKAMIMGFLIYLPFIVIDMVVSSTLMSMGMMMLPPTTISMPFKILLFVLADGWNLVIGQLIKTFY